jgi:rSAM/selenodomain-associated transferase 1
MADNAALLVFAKVPRPGRVKTRLTPALTPTEAARLYTAFLRDTMRQSRRLSGADVRLYLAPSLPDGDIDGVPADVTLHEQAGDGLGERMKGAFKDTLRDGYERVIVVGSDHPTLPLSFLQEAVRALDDSESLCLGPTEDGGFYLLGMSAFYPQLFDDMSYSHSGVFADTLVRAEQTDAQITVLPQWYDVDTPEDLRRMLSDLASTSVKAPNTHFVAEALELEALL